MKIRALTLLHGSEITAKAGDIVTVSDAFGRVLIDAGAAVEIEEPKTTATTTAPEPEAAVLETPERAVLPSARPRRVSSADEPREGDKAP